MESTAILPSSPTEPLQERTNQSHFLQAITIQSTRQRLSDKPHLPDWLVYVLPNNILEANAGFRHELSLGSASRQSTEEELTWGVDTRIVVHARNAAFAEVKVAEEQMTSQFRLVTAMQGRMRAVFVDATRNQAFVKYIEGDLATIVESMLSKRRPPSNFINSKPQVWVETRKNGNKVLMIETSGKCMFRFGVHQEVEVNQKPT
ncbi:uncharacterized protein DEA37_0007202 [Paragonimus westermani]|uniref:Uncharacterized protein n=1 Tax=Paragonimus westermani TaxID=34504 RepID=A0A5J4P2I6_9TREM|nr:uncharacterized protein DEA37_0007202 [Paragonimus westermani]